MEQFSNKPPQRLRPAAAVRSPFWSGLRFTHNGSMLVEIHCLLSFGGDDCRLGQDPFRPTPCHGMPSILEGVNANSVQSSTDYGVARYVWVSTDRFNRNSKGKSQPNRRGARPPPPCFPDHAGAVHCSRRRASLLLHSCYHHTPAVPSHWLPGPAASLPGPAWYLPIHLKHPGSGLTDRRPTVHVHGPTCLEAHLEDLEVQASPLFFSFSALLLNHHPVLISS